MVHECFFFFGQSINLLWKFQTFAYGFLFCAVYYKKVESPSVLIKVRAKLKTKPDLHAAKKCKILEGWETVCMDQPSRRTEMHNSIAVLTVVYTGELYAVLGG